MCIYISKLSKSHLDGAVAPAVQTPVVVHVEADHAQYGQVEQDLPAGQQTAEAIEPAAPGD